MIRRRSGTVLALVLTGAVMLSAGGCAGAGSSNGSGDAEPDHVQVQHILVSFAGKLPGKLIQRNEKEAGRLANEILGRAEAGEDFDALVEKYTDDSPPGVYGMANHGVVPEGENEYRREDMVPGFGDVAFGLAPGGIGMCTFDAMNSPFGFHIIKRLQ